MPSNNPAPDKRTMFWITFKLISNLIISNVDLYEQLDLYNTRKKGDKNGFKKVTGDYICSLINGWETFFRDLFISISDIDKQISDKLTAALKENETVPPDLTIGKYVAGKYNFKLLNQIREAFGCLLEEEAAELTDFITKGEFNGILTDKFLMCKEWYQKGVFKKKMDETIHKAYNIRLLVTHNADYEIDLDLQFLAEVELVFQFVPQFFASTMAIRFSQKLLVTDKKNNLYLADNPSKDELPFSFSTSDILRISECILKSKGQHN